MFYLHKWLYYIVPYSFVRVYNILYILYIILNAYFINIYNLQQNCPIYIVIERMIQLEMHYIYTSIYTILILFNYCRNKRLTKC